MGNKNESFIILLLRIWNKDPAFQKQAHFATTLSNAKVLNGKKNFNLPRDIYHFFGLFLHSNILTQHFEGNTGLYSPR